MDGEAGLKHNANLLRNMFECGSTRLSSWTTISAIRLSSCHSMHQISPLIRRRFYVSCKNSVFVPDRQRCRCARWTQCRTGISVTGGALSHGHNRRGDIDEVILQRSRAPVMDQLRNLRSWESSEPTRKMLREGRL